MKNKLGFAVFLISRFKGLVIYLVGLGILIYSIFQGLIAPVYFPNIQIDDSVILLASVVALSLMGVGLFIRHNSKKYETKQPPS